MGAHRAGRPRPYSNGRWCWTAYGWTWVPAEPWGYASFALWTLGILRGARLVLGARPDLGPGLGVVGDRPRPRRVVPVGYRDRPVWGLDRAVPRGHGSSAGRQGPGWTFARHGDMGTRDLARRRLDAGAVELPSLQVADTPRARPTRDLRAIETPRAVPRAGYQAIPPRDGAAERRADRTNTIPWPGAVRRDREGERRAPDAREGGERAPARDGGCPRPPDRFSARRRATDGASTFPRGGSRLGPSGARRAPAERPTAGRGAHTPRAGHARRTARRARSGRDTGGAPARERARPRDRQPDRDVMRQLFQPLAEPRSEAPRGGSEPRLRVEAIGRNPGMALPLVAPAPLPEAVAAARRAPSRPARDPSPEGRAVLRLPPSHGAETGTRSGESPRALEAARRSGGPPLRAAERTGRERRAWPPAPLSRLPTPPGRATLAMRWPLRLPALVLACCPAETAGFGPS